MLPMQDNMWQQALQPIPKDKIVPDRFHLKKKLGQGTFSKFLDKLSVYTLKEYLWTQFLLFQTIYLKFKNIYLELIMVNYGPKITYIQWSTNSKEIRG